MESLLITLTEYLHPSQDLGENRAILSHIPVHTTESGTEKTFLLCLLNE